MNWPIRLAAGLFCLLLLSSCNYPTPPAPVDTLGPPTAAPTLELTSTPTPVPQQTLTVCLGTEPASLFLYADASSSARSIRQAIYDGPVDMRGYTLQPVILEKIPSLENGDAFLEAVVVQPGDTIADASDALVTLAEGVSYLPAGCTDETCAVVYQGNQPAQMDQLVVRYRLKTGISWTDGITLTAQDSQYAYDLARQLFPRVRPELLRYTASYQALDELTVEWRPWPGRRDAQFAANFFTPLPKHAWEAIPLDQLLVDERVNRMPLGWGPYRIEQWVAGDHISLTKNPAYFRHTEGLPTFDRLVFRFTSGSSDALQALQTGECDLAEESALADASAQELLQLQESGKVKTSLVPGTAWELLSFGMLPVEQPVRGAELFQSRELRQALAACLDRQQLVDELFAGQSVVPDTYVPPAHPMANPTVRKANYDPVAGAALLEAAGWRDLDQDPSTPRVAQGVPDIADGTPLEIEYLAAQGAEQEKAVELIRHSLAGCGIGANIRLLPAAELLAPGPAGPVFGRQFELAQYAWAGGLSPACGLFVSSAIPGAEPAFSTTWWGANAGGYSNPAFDQACQLAQRTLPGTPEHQAAQLEAQAIFAEDLPALPLYLHLKMTAMRPELCGWVSEPGSDSLLWNLESLEMGVGCAP